MLDPNFDLNHCCQCGDRIDREMGINELESLPWCDPCYFYEMRRLGTPIFVFPSGRLVNIWLGDLKDKPSPINHNSSS